LRGQDLAATSELAWGVSCARLVGRVGRVIGPLPGKGLIGGVSGPSTRRPQFRPYHGLSLGGTRGAGIKPIRRQPLWPQGFPDRSDCGISKSRNMSSAESVPRHPTAAKHMVQVPWRNGVVTRDVWRKRTTTQSVRARLADALSRSVSEATPDDACPAIGYFRKQNSRGPASSVTADGVAVRQSHSR